MQPDYQHHPLLLLLLLLLLDLQSPLRCCQLRHAYAWRHQLLLHC
jgi:hypothetical protein